jgi:hypothetical protein
VTVDDRPLDDPRIGAMPQHPTAPRPAPGNGAPPRPPANGRPGPWPPADRPWPDPRPNGRGPHPFPGDPNAGGPAPVPAPRGSTDGAAATPAAPKKAAELSLTKVLAGAGAAATTAVLGSFYGADGTVYGAAIGSVASTVVTTVYQRSLDRTRETLVARVRPRVTGRGGAGADAATVVLPRPPVDGTPPGDVQPDAPARPRRPRWVLWVGATVLIFVISMVAITGIELAKGSTITGGASGTSVGKVVAPQKSDKSDEESGGADTSATESPTTAPKSSATTTPAPDAGQTTGDTQQQDGEQQLAPGGAGSNQDGTAPSTRTAPRSSAPAATPQPGPGSGTGSNG